MLNEIQDKVNKMKHTTQYRFNQNMNNLRGQMNAITSNPTAQKAVKKVIDKLK